ncbi:sugar transferase [Homoserinibacter sp. YIM 151385]|uniref:sugar transferase n=1 Tax=Homoserinibacter sp. YIM 151385 TaxID=2985506 RepID=UPI0022EFFB7D|nr:sugar transferase [Homoserinibacter sp. YIM 151385]WBU38826.1 sugar transferase [Homoserinibacter sp. YIM 151385]
MTAHDAPRTTASLAGHLSATLDGARSHARRITTTSSPHWDARYRRLLAVSDLLVIMLVTVAGSWASRLVIEPGRSTAPITGLEWSLPVVVAVGWLGVLASSRTREASIVGVGATEYRRVARATVVAFALVASGLAVLDLHTELQRYLALFAIGITSLLVTRWIWRLWLGVQRREGRYLSTALVVGSADEVAYVVGRMERRRRAGYLVVGAATDEDLPGGRIEIGGRSIARLADLEHVAGAAHRVGADAVVVVGEPVGDRDYVRRLSWALEGGSTQLVLASSLTDVAGPRIHFRPVEGLPLVQVELPQFSGAKHLVKRAMDIALAALALLLLAPLLAAIAIAIRLDSPGAAVFRQERVGRNGETFTMLKFRSMVDRADTRLGELLDADEGAGVLFKMRQDPRVTRLGRILRKYSLDELPQIWNVLVGDMSLVGPRPPLQREVDGYESHVHRRLYIKPGLTGMWQVNGRSDLSWEESVRLDLYYVENWSITGDLMIMWRTARVIVTGSGAY